MWALGGVQFDEGYRDRRLLWRELKADFLLIGLGLLLAFGLFVSGAWILTSFVTVKVLIVYILAGALYGAVNDYYLKSRCDGDKAYAADLLYLVLTMLVGFGVLFIARFGAAWAIGPLPPLPPTEGYALIYDVVSLFSTGTAAGGFTSHTIFERRYSAARWYRSGKEFGTRRRRIVFYLRPLSARP